MVISFNKNFLFIHIYKVAGSSLSKALGIYEPATVRLRKILIADTLAFFLKISGQINKEKEFSVDFLNYKKLPIHATAVEIKDKIGADLYDRLFKFAFVRNPWDWQVSLYHYMLQNPNHYQHRKIKALKNFNNYIYWRIENKPKLQKDFITGHDGNIMVDYIGKIETIKKDIHLISKHINTDLKIPHINRSKRLHFKEYYTRETFEIILRHYFDDIKLFGYPTDY